MNRSSAFPKFCLLIVAVLLSWQTTAAENDSLDPNLEALRPLLEKTWKGELNKASEAKPAVDIQRWERALNGKAVRILHSVNQGVYGGESIVWWDAKKRSVVYYYFTTAGFMTTGTMSVKDGKLVTHEVVSGNQDGITEVKGTTEIASNGTFHVKTEYLKNGDWVPGRDVTYKEDSSSTVQFK